MPELRAAIRTVAGLLLAAPWFAAASANGPPSYVPGDVIVKFTDASSAGLALTRALQAEQLPVEVTHLAVQLSGELGVPLVATRVTSGRELVLSIDRDQLARRLAQQVARDPAVRSVAPIAAPKTILPAVQIAFAVAPVRDSELDRTLRQTAQSGRKTAAALDALAARLAGSPRLAVAGQVGQGGELLLTVDIAALTRTLIADLQRRADVEYAQPSHVLHPLGVGAPSRPPGR